jgi:restriction system protein
VRFAKVFPKFADFLPPLYQRCQKWDEVCEAEASKRSAELAEYSDALNNWEKTKELFLQEQTSEIEKKQRLYLGKDRDALVEYWTRILERPISLEQSPCVRNLNSFEENSRLVVEYALPKVSLLPKVEEVTYLLSKNALINLYVSDERSKSMYFDHLIKIALISMYKLFQSDVANSLRSVAFNGTVSTIDPATGREVHPCVIAVAAEKSSFMEMNFSLIDPVACFKRMNGRISENLGELSAIDPMT